MNNYKVFTRNWWRFNENYPNGLEPSAGRRTTIGYANTEDEAREMCLDYNRGHKAGVLSRKAEYSLE